MEVPFNCKDSTLQISSVEDDLRNTKLIIGGSYSNKKTPKAPRHKWKIGRNEKCPCGSGKKFKMCHLAEVKGESSGRLQVDTKQL